MNVRVVRVAAAVRRYMAPPRRERVEWAERGVATNTDHARKSKSGKNASALTLEPTERFRVGMRHLL
jgi:hypothetical protein